MKHTLLFCFIVLIMVSSCKKEDTQVYEVTYNIGCSDCMVAYTSDQQGNQLSEYHKSTGWAYNFSAKKGQEVLLMAYNTSSNPQGVTATIMLNGNVLETRTTYCPISGVSFCVDTIR